MRRNTFEDREPGDAAGSLKRDDRPSSPVTPLENAEGPREGEHAAPRVPLYSFLEIAEEHASTVHRMARRYSAGLRWIDADDLGQEMLCLLLRRAQSQPNKRVPLWRAVRYVALDSMKKLSTFDWEWPHFVDVSGYWQALELACMPGVYTNARLWERWFDEEAEDALIEVMRNPSRAHEREVWTCMALGTSQPIPVVQTRAKRKPFA